METGRDAQDHLRAAVCQSPCPLWEGTSLCQYSKWPQLSSMSQARSFSSPHTIFLMQEILCTSCWFLFHFKRCPFHADPQFCSHTLSSTWTVPATHSLVRPSPESHQRSPAFPSSFSLFHYRLHLLQTPPHQCISFLQVLPGSIPPLPCHFVLSLMFILNLDHKQWRENLLCSLHVEHRAYSWIQVQVVLIINIYHFLTGLRLWEKIIPLGTFFFWHL